MADRRHIVLTLVIDTDESVHSVAEGFFTGEWTWAIADVVDFNVGVQSGW